ncbi:2'-5' RNA ligase family protein [Streptomyces sp. CJ_13]|uniref:2'-5' RNA ligase family protein n=1 Tax=Streptomyces sp. CJ_13 TaxID=2724943 RepID=UPI001BDC1DD3|nr:2'-5' RNA ligase family protein [Streptomyces sp. CJ_13]MBT1188086.1 2'-5' RNA ligase family protein [Streptomyces sp. CJ_13]
MTPDLDVHPAAFPQSPPPDLVDPGVIVEHDWRAFSAVERMKDHWARPGWADGHRAYYWMLTFPEAVDLITQARHCQDELAHLGMDPVPADGLHVTMVRIGSTEAVPESKVRLLAGLAEQLPQESFRITAHPLAGSRGAVRYTLTPWAPLVSLHAALSSIGQRAGVPGGSPTSAFRPHLGVQYSNRECAAAPVVESVARLRTVAPIALEIASVDLVELRRTAGPPAYRWRVVRSIPLRPAPTRSIRQD